jgi:pimeloyl-ACP methyl ester carboxylesterase
MFIEIDGKKIHYEQEGSGAPIIFVHGWGGTINSLRNLAHLASKQYKTTILDLPGFGQSKNPAPDWGVEQYADLVIKFIQKLNLNPVLYFGHSFGGSLGLYISVNKPEIIKKLVLCNSAYKRSQKTSKSVKSIKSQILAKIPFFDKVEKPIKYIVYRILFPKSDLIKFPHLESNFRIIMTQDLTDLADKVKTPTLILWGDQDTYTPVAYAYELHKKIKNSQLKVFPDIRHNLPLQYPELVWEEMKNFL